jgi:hypothetical protein
VSAHKIAGCCSLCDEPVYEVKQRWDAGEKRAGEPKVLGPANPDATRIEFLLFNGRRTSMTFCGQCAESLTFEQYTPLWQKNLNGYMREQNGSPEKFKDEFANGLLCELARFNVKELNERGC